jgi:hypothetical protein
MDSEIKSRRFNLNDNKWVVDYGNSSLNILLNKEFDSEEEAIEWGKEINKTHMFKHGDCEFPLTYLHMVYEPKIIENDVLPCQDEVAAEGNKEEGDD